MKKLLPNRGYNHAKELADRKPTDYKLGGAGKVCIAEVPIDAIEAYLPLGEVQRGREDFMDCASRSPLNILETKFNYLLGNGLLAEPLVKWLTEKGYYNERGVEFSDRFIAVLSGTTRDGNSLVAPIDAIHNFGLIPKKLLPASSEMNWDEYHDPEKITPELKALGEEFLRRFNINYERLDESNFGDRFLAAAGYAWPSPKDGIYPRVPYQPNHAFAKWKPTEYHRAFDNYEEASGDFIKELASDYDFLDFGYRLIISVKKSSEGNWLTILLNWVKSWFN